MASGFSSEYGLRAPGKLHAMADRDARELEAEELRLLGERTEVLSRQEELLSADEWPREEAEELSRRHDRIEAELAEVREKLKRLARREGREG